MMTYRTVINVKMDMVFISNKFPNLTNVNKLIQLTMNFTTVKLLNHILPTIGVKISFVENVINISTLIRQTENVDLNIVNLIVIVINFKWETIIVLIVQTIINL